MNDQDRDELLAAQQRIVEAEAAVERALVARNDLMFVLKERYGRGIVSEMARVLDMNRVTVSDLVNPDGAGTGKRRPTRRTGES